MRKIHSYISPETSPHILVVTIRSKRRNDQIIKLQVRTLNPRLTCTLQSYLTLTRNTHSYTSPETSGRMPRATVRSKRPNNQIIKLQPPTPNARSTPNAPARTTTVSPTSPAPQASTADSANCPDRNPKLPPPPIASRTSRRQSWRWRTRTCQSRNRPRPRNTGRSRPCRRTWSSWRCTMQNWRRDVGTGSGGKDG